MNPRSVALQGIGYGSRLTALQGFGIDVDTAAPPSGLRFTFPRPARRVEEEDEWLLLLSMAVASGQIY